MNSKEEFLWGWISLNEMLFIFDNKNDWLGYFIILISLIVIKLLIVVRVLFWFGFFECIVNK